MKVDEAKIVLLRTKISMVDISKFRTAKEFCDEASTLVNGLNQCKVEVSRQKHSYMSLQPIPRSSVAYYALMSRQKMPVCLVVAVRPNIQKGLCCGSATP